MNQHFLTELIHNAQEKKHPIRVVPECILSSERNLPHVHNGYELRFFSNGHVDLVPPVTQHESVLCDASLEVLPHLLNGIRGKNTFRQENVSSEYQALLKLLDAVSLLTQASPSVQRETAASVLAVVDEILISAPEAEAENDPRTRALYFMTDHYYDRALSVSDISDHAGVSPQYLNRLFHRHDGCGVRQKLIALRLEQARMLLDSGRYGVASVSLLTGWNSPFHFSNAFRKRFGITPSSAAGLMRKNG